MTTSRFSNGFLEVLNACGLTVYGAAQVIGAETDEPLQVIEARLKSYLGEGRGITLDRALNQLIVDLDALGYELHLVRK